MKNKEYKPFARQKTPEELEKQLREVESHFELSFVPSKYAENTEEIMQMDPTELVSQYPERFRIYTKLLSEKRFLENNYTAEYTEKDLAEMQRLFAILNNIDTHVENIINDGETHLREHQVTTFELFREFLEQGGKTGYFKLPTGTGKTVVFIELLKVLSVSSLVLVPSRDLVKQTKTRIDQFAPDLEPGAYYTSEKSPGAETLVSTYQSLQSLLDNPNFDLDKIGVVILDEAHESLSKKRKALIQELINAGKLIIGFTATSEYNENKTVKGLLEKEIHSMNLKEVIEMGALAPCSAVVVTTLHDISNVRITSTGNYDEKELEKAINIESRNQAVVELATKTFVGKQKIIFGASINHCNSLAQKMYETGTSEIVEVIVGTTEAQIDEKYKRLGYAGGWKEAYAENVINTVISVKLISRGTDLPNAEICINASPTRSLVEATQRGGRVTRLDPNNPDKHAIVVDVLDAGNKKFKGNHENGKPVLFHQILGGTVVVPLEQNGKTKKGSSTPVELLEIEEYTLNIEGLNIIFDLEEMIRLTHKETKEEEQGKWRWIIKNLYTIEQFLNMSNKQKHEKINGQTLTSMARMFGINGQPEKHLKIFKLFAEAIYGQETIENYFILQ